LDGAVVVTAPQSGEVNAIVGGRRVGFSGFNRALDANRSMGSLSKPIVYLAGIETGRYNPASIVNDVPVSLKLPTGQVWEPKNDEKEIEGPIPLVRALARSLNLATVNFGLEIGVEPIAKEFSKLGLGREPPKVPAIMLGGFDVTPMEAAQLYNTLANGGFRAPLRAVRAVVDAEGKPLKAFPLEVEQVADPAAVYQVNRMMVEVMRRGTAAAARPKLGNVVMAGKTGTSSDNRDSWFAGFSGSHLAVVWVGYDDNQSTGLYGNTGALPVWTQLMSSIDNTSWDVPLPDELKEVLIDYPTGLGATAGCTNTVIVVPVPQGTNLPMHEGCGNAVTTSLERAGTWFRGIIGK
jgi:penicillin-binding protein 1B